MTTQIITLSPRLFIDIEGADISYSEATLQLNQTEVKRSSIPFSEMKYSKFRKVFDRHTVAYRH